MTAQLSKYTTEVRYICEFEAGLLESGGYNDTDDIINKSWNKIFKTSWPIFNESYRETLCKKILSHYYTREVCAETVGLWKFWLNTKMNEIMPYYNQLYLSAQKDFDPFNEIDFTKEIIEDSSQNKNGKGSNTGAINSTDNLTGESSQSLTGDISRNASSDESQNQSSSTQTTSNGKELHSDTPQGSIQNIAENGYLTDAVLTDNNTSTNNSTDATKNTTRTEAEKTSSNNNTKNSSKSTSSAESSSSNTYDEAINGAKNILETYRGKNSSVSYSKLIEEYRQTFLNIDLEIILSLSDLFMNIY